MRFGLPLLSVLLVPVLLASACSSEASPGDVGIGIGELEDHMRYLAADERGGRFPGTRGIRDAEEYIAGRFAAMGLEEPPGFEGWFDSFPLHGRPWDLDSFIEFDGERYYPGTGFAPLILSGEAGMKAPLVFVGYGIEASEFGHFDYRGLDVSGKIVVAIRHEPEERNADSAWKGREFTEHATFLSKARLARSRGAAGFLTFTDPLHHDAEESLHIIHSLELESEAGEDPALHDFPALLISRELAEEILAPILDGSDRTLEELQRLSETGRPEVDGELGDILIDLKKREGDVLEARNVGGLYRPPAGGEGTVIVGAHHDHLGGTAETEAGVDAIFNGADDNASGVTALLEIAEEIALTRPDLPFSVLFVTFSAEEAGLLGSRSLSSRLPAELAPWRMMINLDMVGRNPERPVTVYEAGLDAAQKGALRRLAEDSGIEIVLEADTGPGMSDHFPFRQQGIPALFFFTGFHAQYHQVDDAPETIDFARLRRVADLAFRFLRDGV